MFTKLEGDSAVLFRKGVFTQADLYKWQGGLYAKLGGGFVRLRSNGGTSHPDVLLKHLTIDRPLFSDRFGRLAVNSTPDGTVTELPKPEVAKLTGGEA